VPSIISHAVVALAAGTAFAPRETPEHFWWISVACSILPDADVLAFSLGIPYGHFFGHRGFFHSPFFGFLVGFLVASVLLHGGEIFSGRWFFYSLYFSLLTASHGVLDAFTNGGLGIALLSPFDSGRYFFPWRPIMVSPIGIAAFIGNWGLMVIKSEFWWIWLPSSLVAAFSAVIRTLLARN